jgi:hypothetical protein
MPWVASRIFDRTNKDKVAAQLYPYSQSTYKSRLRVYPLSRVSGLKSIKLATLGH